MHLENKDNTEYIIDLERIKKHFKYMGVSSDQNGRIRVIHGRIHTRFWSKEAFELLIHEIVELSKHSRF